MAYKHIGEELRHLFNRCLKEGNFPPVWRGAQLVLLRKEIKPADTPAIGQSVCWTRRPSYWRGSWRADSSGILKR